MNWTLSDEISKTVRQPNCIKWYQCKAPTEQNYYNWFTNYNPKVVDLEKTLVYSGSLYNDNAANCQTQPLVAAQNGFAKQIILEEFILCTDC